MSSSIALHITYWVRDSRQTRNSLIVASLATQLVQACQVFCGLWGPSLLPSHLHGKCFSHWAISSVLSPSTSLGRVSLPEQGTCWLKQMCWPESPGVLLSPLPSTTIMGVSLCAQPDEGVRLWGPQASSVAEPAPKAWMCVTLTSSSSFSPTHLPFCAGT